MTANQKRIRDKYTNIAKICGRWTTMLSIGVQSFHVVEGTSRARAKWYADMLAVAIENLIKEEAPK